MTPPADPRAPGSDLPRHPLQLPPPVGSNPDTSAGPGTGGTAEPSTTANRRGGSTPVAALQQPSTYPWQYHRPVGADVIPTPPLGTNPGTEAPLAPVNPEPVNQPTAPPYGPHGDATPPNAGPAGNINMTAPPTMPIQLPPMTGDPDAGWLVPAHRPTVNLMPVPSAPAAPRNIPAQPADLPQPYGAGIPATVPLTMPHLQRSANPPIEARPAPPTEQASDVAATTLSSSMWMSLGTLMSRLLGMVRVAALSWAIGGALAADAFNTANTLPNTLFILIGGGVLNAVLVPQMVRAAQNADGGQDYTDRLVTLAIVILGGATVVLTALAPVLVHLFATKWNDATFALAIQFAWWCLPQIFFYGLYTIYGQILNARNSFGPYMWAPVINNVVALVGIAAYVWVSGRHGPTDPALWTTGEVAVLGSITTLGVVAQALVLVPALHRHGYRWRPRWGWRGIGLRTAGTVAGWTFAGVAVTQVAFVGISQILNNAGAAAARSGQPASGRTVWDYGFLLFMLPHSLITVSLVTAIFTRMSDDAHRRDLAAVREGMSFSLRIAMMPTAFATTVMLVVGPEVTHMMFPGTDTSTTDQYANVAMALLLGLVPFSAQYLLQRVFFAFEDARTPFIIGLITSTLWTASAWWVSTRVEPSSVPGMVGLLLSVTNLMGVLLTIIPLRRRLGTIDGSRVAMTCIQVFIAAVVAASTGLILKVNFAGMLSDSTLATYVRTGLVVAVMVLTYFGGLRVLRVPELQQALAPLLAKVRRSSR